MIRTRWQMVGTPRSGSNLLRLMLGQLPGFFAPPSVHILRGFEDVVSAYGPLNNPQSLQALVADVLRMMEAVVLKWPQPLPTVDEVLQHCTGPSLEHVYLALHDAATARLGAVHWISKDLENVTRLEPLSAAEPDFGVVHLIRDPRDVALSFANSPIHHKHPVAGAWKWAEDLHAANRFRPQVQPEQWVEVRYEGLVRDARSELRRFCELTAVIDISAALDFHRAAEATEAPALSALWTNLGTPLITDNLEKYRRSEHEEFVRSVEEAIFDLMVECGFEPLYADRQRHFSRVEIAEIKELDNRLRQHHRAMNDPAVESMHIRQRDALDAIRRSLMDSQTPKGHNGIPAVW